MTIRGNTASSSDDGSALMLVPAAVLVLLMLGAIAIDSAVVLLAQRDLADRTAGVANDIAGFASSDEAFYRSGAVRLSSPEAARYTVLAFPATDPPDGYRSWSASAEIRGERSVAVTAIADVSYIFAKALPGMPDSVEVRATSVATARGG